ncbi:hypothetical protein [Psychroflexus tropicus]|uniref:hypothetical protein n=1 Tax=Psychroflexus tropicus TaxID=197345 RepID=UPI000380732A|nr:hypothetical protein [Psychroflexus tropicus]
MKKTSLLLIALLCFQLASSQTSNINAFEYVIIPMQFDFQSEPNKYQLNILSRVLLKEEGFKVFMSTEERPLDYRGNTCKPLFFEVEDTSGYLSISVVARLKDCYDNVLFESEEGKTKIKDFKEGYQDALKKALSSLSEMNYRYNSSLEKYPERENDQLSLNPASSSEDKVIENAYSDKRVYKLGGKTYWLVSVDQGDYKLLSNSGKVNYATLSKADKGSYIFNSISISGAAYFDAEGNLNVEYMDKDLNELQYMTFKEVNQ